ncbi:PAS domain-containing protein [Methylobacterium sp. JK268]
MDEGRGGPDEAARLARAVEIGGLGLWDLDLDAGHLATSALCRRIFGRAEDLPFSYDDLLAVLHPEDRRLLTDAVAGAAAAGAGFSGIYRVLTPAGTPREVEMRGGVEDARAPRRLVGVALDRTESRRVERALRDSEAQHAAIFAQSAAGFAVMDAEGRFTRVNPRYCQIVGRRAEDLLAGLPLLAITHPDDRARNRALFEGAREAGRPFDIEERCLRPDGRTVWVRNSVAAIRDEGGRVREMLGVCVDISATKAAEEELRANEERLRLAVEVGGLGTWDWDLATGAVDWSDEHYRIQGYAVGEVTPSFEAWAARVHPEDLLPATARIAAARDARHPYAHEFRLVHPDGTVRWCMARGRFFYDGERPVRMIGVIMDTTERRGWAERQELLIAELQHRTRNLLSVVRSIAEQTLARTGPTERFREQFNDRLSALSRVQGLLSRSDQEPITLPMLIRTELDALGIAGFGDRVRLAGPEVRLRKGSVQTFALALHELATNARKHGAFACEAGRLSVTWRVAADGEGRRLALDWIEEDIRRSAPPRPDGFGRHLIERALPYALQARTRYDLGETRLHCAIDLPLADPAGG